MEYWHNSLYRTWLNSAILYTILCFIISRRPYSSGLFFVFRSVLLDLKWFLGIGSYPLSALYCTNQDCLLGLVNDWGIAICHHLCLKCITHDSSYLCLDKTKFHFKCVDIHIKTLLEDNPKTKATPLLRPDSQRLLS